MARRKKRRKRRKEKPDTVPHRPNEDWRRNRQMFRYYQKGWSLQEVADYYYLPKQRAYQIIKREAEVREEPLRTKLLRSNTVTPIPPEVAQAYVENKISAKEASQSCGFGIRQFLKRLKQQGISVGEGRPSPALAERYAAIQRRDEEMYGRFLAGERGRDLAAEYHLTEASFWGAIFKHRQRTGAPKKKTSGRKRKTQ